MSEMIHEIPYDLEQMLISALRYALGRRSYIVEITNDCIRPRISTLTTLTLSVMHRDLTDFLATWLSKGHSACQSGLFEDEITGTWMSLLSALEVELWQRNAGDEQGQFAKRKPLVVDTKMNNRLHEYSAQEDVLV